MRGRIHRPVLHLGARRIFPKEVVIVPIRRRSDRSRDEPAAAIWADISQNVFNASNAEGALIGTDTRLKRVRRQCFVAVFTSRSELKHGVLDVKLPEPGNQWFLELFSVSALGDTAWQRRRRVLLNKPSYSQAGGILRMYFGQECSRPLCFDTA
jgi:hypothetical protein